MSGLAGADILRKQKMGGVVIRPGQHHLPARQGPGIDRQRSHKVGGHFCVVLRNLDDHQNVQLVVAVGANASRPHHESGGDAVEDGLLLLDYGCVVDGYHSDMTRTIFRGGDPDEELVRVYEAVRESNQAGIDAAKPGVVAADVDRVCREVLAGHGLAENFLHSTGHGVGLEIHEGPGVNSTSKEVLEPGNVVTIEPGAYLVGVLGVRIEDMVLVTESGNEVLTNSHKELIVS